MIGVLLMGVVLVVPPLGEDHAARLALMVDGQAARRDPFAALVEHLATWPVPSDVDLDAIPVRRQVDWSAVVSAPAAFRGDLVVVEGVLRLRTPLKRRFSALAMEEWFVEDGEITVIAFVPALETAPNRAARVRVLGRVYGVVGERSQDGLDRQWPALVGIALPLKPPTTGPFVLVGLVVVGVVVLFALRRAASSSRKADVEHALALVRQDADEEETPSGPLPEDPALALEAMREEHDENA